MTIDECLTKPKKPHVRYGWVCGMGGLQKLITFFSGWAGLQKLLTDLDMKNGYKGGVKGWFH